MITISGMLAMVWATNESPMNDGLHIRSYLFIKFISVHIVDGLDGMEQCEGFHPQGAFLVDSMVHCRITSFTASAARTQYATSFCVAIRSDIVT
jgi:hypothetical protein